MDDLVRYTNKVQVRVIKDCQTRDGLEVCEHLIYLSVPKAGGDGMLLGVVETEEAAEVIASTLNGLIGAAHTHA